MAAAGYVAAGVVGVAAEGVSLRGVAVQGAVDAQRGGIDLDEETDRSGAVLVRLHGVGGIAKARERAAGACRGEVAALAQRFQCLLDTCDGRESVAATLSVQGEGVRNPWFSA